MYLMTIPKLAVISFLSGFLLNSLPQSIWSYTYWSDFLPHISGILIFTGLLSCFVGALALNAQWDIKRFLAYSGISHIGFILLSLAAAGSDLSTHLSPSAEVGAGASFAIPVLNSVIISSFSGSGPYFNYAIVYAFTSINIFLILTLLGYILGKEVKSITELAGLFRINPSLSLAFMFSILSFIGIPPLLGFYAKFFVLFSYVQGTALYVALLAILASLIGCGRYLTLIKVSLFDWNLTPTPPAVGSLLGHTPSTLPNPLPHTVLSYIISFITLFLILGPLTFTRLSLFLELYFI